MAENEVWGHHNLKTAADVRRMLQGLPPEQEGAAMPPTPALPAGAVSATIETVEERPLQTTETVQVVEDGTRTVVHDEPKRSHSKKVD